MAMRRQDLLDKLKIPNVLVASPITHPMKRSPQVRDFQIKNNFLKGSNP